MYSTVSANFTAAVQDLHNSIGRKNILKVYNQPMQLKCSCKHFLLYHDSYAMDDYEKKTCLRFVVKSSGDRIKIVTRCNYAQGRVKRLSPSIYMYNVCVSAKNTAVCCLTARKSPRNSSLPLGLAIHILRKMPTKSDESSVECYGHGF